MKSMMKIVTIAMMLTLIGCTTAVTPTAELEAITFQLHWKPTTDFLGFYVALDKGFYEEEGFDVTIRPLSEVAESITLPALVESGEVDFAIGTVELVRAQSNGAPLVPFATIMQLGPAAFFARTETGINTPADLAGHSVVVKGDTWETLLIDLLARDGLTLDDVEAIPGGFDMTPFLEGEVEVWAGFITDEVVRARMAGLDIVTLPLYDYGSHGGSIIIYTTQARLNENHEQVEGFLRATLQGWQWAIDNPTEAVDILLERFPDMAAERDFHLASFTATIQLVDPFRTPLGSMDCELWFNRPELSDLDSTEDLCTTELVEALSE